MAAIKPSDHRVEYWDQLLPGFGIRVSRNARRWFVKTRVDGKQRRIAIDPHLSLAEARREARRLIASPPTPPVVAITFADAVPMFIARWSKPRCRSCWEIERILMRRFPSLMPMPVEAITQAPSKRGLAPLGSATLEQYRQV